MPNSKKLFCENCFYFRNESNKLRSDLFLKQKIIFKLQEELEIIDIDTGKMLGQNKKGELLIKGPTVMNGYYRNLEATSNAIDQEGWMHTGDIAYYDEEGDFYIVDRLKELIKVHAYQVAPAELEALLLAHEEISDAAVLGIPDENAGEVPRAYVVRQKNSKITEKQLIDYIADLVSSPKRLRGGVIFVEEIPKSPSGKILRRVLRDKYVNLKSKY